MKIIMLYINQYINLDLTYQLKSNNIKILNPKLISQVINYVTQLFNNI